MDAFKGDGMGPKIAGWFILLVDGVVRAARDLERYCFLKGTARGRIVICPAHYSNFNRSSSLENQSRKCPDIYWLDCAMG